MSSSVGQFWYWKFNIFLSLENQVSRFFSGSYSSTATFFVILMRCSKVNVDRQLCTSDFILFELKVLRNRNFWPYLEMSYKIYKSLCHSHTQARKNRKAGMNPETVFWNIFPQQRPLLISILQPYSPDWRVLFQHCQWMTILIAYLLLLQRHHYHPFSLKSLIVSNSGTFSHVYVCTRHINKYQYRFCTLNYFDFTLFSSANMTSNMVITKIESMTENYQEFSVANLN